MKPDNISLRHKLMLWLFLPLLLLWLAGAIVAYMIALNFSNHAHDEHLLSDARTLVERIGVTNGEAIINLSQAALEMVQSDGDFYQVISTNGRLLAGLKDLPPPGKITLTKPQFHDTNVLGHDARFASVYVDVPGDAPGQLILVQVGETLEKRKVLAHEILMDVMLPQFILVLLAALVIWLNINRGLTHLQYFCQEIYNRSHRDLRPVPEMGIPQEARPIIHAVNELMQRLGHAMEAQQRFIADAAHQLRTPLAGLKTQTELALRQVDPEQIQHALQQVKISVERINRLVAQMLTLAHAEDRLAGNMELKQLDLCQLAREITAGWVPEAVRKNIDIGYECAEEPAMIAGDELRLKMLLDNLLDNAIRYSPPGSRVTTRVTVGDTIILSVKDNGPGIPENEMERVFQRFYRVLGNQADGSGLGLAIVKEIAELHHARIVLASPPSGAGVLVQVVFGGARNFG